MSRNRSRGSESLPHPVRENGLDDKYECMSDTTHPSEPDNQITVFEPSLPIHANAAGEKRMVSDVGARLRSLANLKPGSSSKRTPEMIREIIERLRWGETLLSVTMDERMPSHSTLHDWMDRDEELDAAIQRAREIGAHMVFDAKTDVAMGGALSTGDRQRDELVIKVLDQAATKRNRTVFGDKVTFDGAIGIAPVVLPTVALPSIPDAEFIEHDDEKPE